MSGLARTRTDTAYSGIYHLSMNSGRFIGVRVDVKNNFQESVFDSEGAIKELEKYMSIVDEWVAVEQVSTKITSATYSDKHQLLGLRLFCDKENIREDSYADDNLEPGPDVTIIDDDPFALQPFANEDENVLSEFTINLPVAKEPEITIKQQLQEGLCEWMENHTTSKNTVKITTLKHENDETRYGVYEKHARNVRSDLADTWRSRRDAEYKMFQTAIESTIELMKEKFDADVIPYTLENQSVKGKLVRVHTESCVFSGLIIEDEDEFAYFLHDAFHYHLNELKGELNIASNTNVDYRDYLERIKKHPYVSASERKRIRLEVTKLQDELKQKYGRYGVDMRFSDMTSDWSGWNTTRRYSINLPLLRRLVDEVDQNGKVMRENKVIWVDFRTDPWDDDKQERRLSINVHSGNMKENNSLVFDLHHEELDKKSQEFYEVFLCTRKDIDPGFSIDIK